jgi:hypothetical protein
MKNIDYGSNKKRDRKSIAKMEEDKCSYSNKAESSKSDNSESNFGDGYEAKPIKDAKSDPEKINGIKKTIRDAC